MSCAKPRPRLACRAAMVITRLVYRAASAGTAHRRAARHRAHQRRDRALVFTALNNQFFSLDMTQPIASLPAVIFQFALSPYEDWQQFAWTGALIITLAVLALNIVARRWPQQGNRHDQLLRSQFRTIARRRFARAARKKSRSVTSIFLRAKPGVARHHIADLRAPGHRVHRAIGLREVDVVTHAQPHLRSLSEPARGRRGADRRREHPFARPGRVALRARVGMLFQKPTPFPLSIYENVAFGIRLHRPDFARGA